MSLLTRCPACTTLYKVVPDQLRISEGWVKCGQCGDIFDASQHLIEVACDPVSPKDEPLNAVQSVESANTHDADDDSWMAASVEPLEADSEQLNSSAQRVGLEPMPEPETTNLVKAELIPPASTHFDAGSELQSLASQLESATEEDEKEPDEESPQDDPSAGEIRVRWDDQPIEPIAAASPLKALAVDDMPVSFMQDGDRPSFWRKPLVRGALLLLSVVLGLSLLAQWVHSGRDQIAAQHPDLKPVLQAFCSLTGCAVQPLQRIESLSVDSVVFHQIDKDAYRLTFTVKNSHQLPLAFPSVELALTDAQDQPVYRRVFSGKELGIEGTEIAAGAEWPVVLALRVSSEVPAQRVLGYRLLAFYP